MLVRKSTCSLLVIGLLFFNLAAAQQKFYLEVEPVFENLLSVADTDGDKKITIEDQPLRPFTLVTEQGDSVKLSRIYYLSNLLQELAMARQQDRRNLLITSSRIKELPADRISRRIRTIFWDDLTRRIDKEGLGKILNDSKASGNVQRLYVPSGDTAAIKYYQEIRQDIGGFEVVVLPKNISPQYVKSINDQPGLLALKLDQGKAVPFVVPGGRFNEMYGWDSYFESIGLLLDGREDLATAMVDNFVYQIKHYGKILNANRSYYLTRTQPPFMSSFIREVYQAMETKDPKWLRKALEAAIKEYEQVWMEQGKRLSPNGLSRYYAEGIGIPPETEPGHFKEILQEFAEKHGISVDSFVTQYQAGDLRDPEADLYFRHDRSVRESGHDTSWRLDNRAAHLNTVDLNSLLYKYEKDFEFLIDDYFDDEFTTSWGKTYTEDYWEEKSERRKKLMNQFLWDEEAGSFFDYNFRTSRKTGYVSATNFYPLWAGIPSEEQADKMVENLMQDLKARGGILASSQASVEKTATNRVQRQWDYPFGWAPHQMLLWQGLLRYEYKEEAYELIYRWLWMITRNAVDYNGTIPEKFNVVDATHKVYAEYGNVGTKFDHITTSGFGWMNASYQLGLELLPEEYKKKLNQLVPPGKLF